MMYDLLHCVPSAPGSNVNADTLAMLANFWIPSHTNATPTPPAAGVDTLTIFSGDGSSSQQTNGSVSNQNLALQQQWNSSESSLTQDVQQIITASSESMGTMISAQNKQ